MFDKQQQQQSAVCTRSRSLIEPTVATLQSMSPEFAYKSDNMSFGNQFEIVFNNFHYKRNARTIARLSILAAGSGSSTAAAAAASMCCTGDAGGDAERVTKGDVVEDAAGAGAEGAVRENREESDGDSVSERG